MIYYIASIASVVPVLVGWLTGLLITTLTLFVLDYGRRVFYRAALDYLQIRAALAGQAHDQERGELELRHHRLMLSAGKEAAE